MSLQEALDEACGLLLRCERYLPRDLELEVDSFRLACIQREVGLLPEPRPEPECATCRDTGAVWAEWKRGHVRRCTDCKCALRLSATVMEVARPCAVCGQDDDSPAASPYFGHSYYFGHEFQPAKPEPVRHASEFCPFKERWECIGGRICSLCVKPERCPTCEGPCRYKDEVAK